MAVERWTDELTPEMIPEPYRHMAEVLGIATFLMFIEEFGGVTTYIPKQESVLRPIRDERIKREFNGYNAEALARRYGLTVRWVQEICKDEGVLPGQVDMFGFR